MNQRIEEFTLVHTPEMDTETQQIRRSRLRKKQGLSHNQISRIFAYEEESTGENQTEQEDQVIEQTPIEETVAELKQLVANLKDLEQLRDVFLEQLQGKKPFMVYFEPKDGKWKATVYPDLSDGTYRLFEVKEP